MTPFEKTVVLVTAAGASWEPPVLTMLDAHPSLVVLKRCVDLDDLLAAASAGQANAAVIGIDTAGLDGRAVERLEHFGVRTVVVVPSGLGQEQARARASRAGVTRIVADDDLGALADVLRTTTPPDPPKHGPPRSRPDDPTDARSGRVLTVWGPGGAPGRSTVATTMAAVLAESGESTILLDADPSGGTIAQQLGILDEVSGLLQAGRLAHAGELADRLATAVKTVGPQLGVITGLPRPDRWTEVRRGLLEEVVAVARQVATVVIDAGSCLEDDPMAELTGRPGRHQLTLDALDVADTIVAVGAPDPVGLARLARGLADVRELGVVAPVRVVINRMRSTLRWSEREVASTLTSTFDLAMPAPDLHFLPEGAAAADQALVTGRSLVEVAPEAALTRAIEDVVEAMAVSR